MSNANDHSAALPVDTQPLGFEPSRLRIRAGLTTTLIGLFTFTVGAKPDWFGWDRSPVVGFVQIAVFLLGLGIICLGGWISLLALWKGKHRTIAADIGLRLVGTGYAIAVFAGMADVFGMGSQPLPQVPYFGPWQASGVLIGQIIIAAGFLLLIPYEFGNAKR
ncbi:MAG: hypothetical protein HYR70_02110 [Chloroflexi bacterium]|nr:hypothetical protein [Chloroflexota bacterium]MBI3341015.1 hypothetical protein [Chloroflexota bacterium]